MQPNKQEVKRLILLEIKIMDQQIHTKKTIFLHRDQTDLFAIFGESVGPIQRCCFYETFKPMAEPC